MKRGTSIKTCIIVASTVVICTTAWPTYRYYREKLTLRQIHEFLARGDYRNASLSARRLLMLNPDNIQGCRLLGQLEESTHPREALEWYLRMTGLQPTTENRLQLAAKALRFEGPPYRLAAQTLAQLADSATNRVSYCVLCAELSLRRANVPEAENWFEAARRLQPTNELHELNLAMLRLHSTNNVQASEARATLWQLRGNKALCALALRSLVAEAMTRHDWESAENLSRELLTTPGVELQDKLQHLDLLKNSPEAKPFRESLQLQVATNAAEVSLISGWMIQQGEALQALAWLTNASAIPRELPSIRLATVECLVALGDWQEADTLLKARKWGELEPMRLGFLSQTAAARHDGLAADLEWRQALKSAQKRLGSLMWLADKAGEWTRDKAKETALWEIVRQFPNQRWALLELARIAQRDGRTRDLHRAYSSMLDSAPNDPVLLNDFAATGLLLQTDLDKAHETASKLFAQYPAEPTIISTYAYSLYLQKRIPEGLAALESLSQQCLTNPPIALYYGLLLRADGQTERAATYLQMATVASLLPEERKLLQRPSKGH